MNRPHSVSRELERLRKVEKEHEVELLALLERQVERATTTSATTAVGETDHSNPSAGSVSSTDPSTTVRASPSAQSGKGSEADAVKLAIKEQQIAIADVGSRIAQLADLYRADDEDHAAGVQPPEVLAPCPSGSHYFMVFVAERRAPSVAEDADVTTTSGTAAVVSPASSTLSFEQQVNEWCRQNRADRVTGVLVGSAGTWLASLEGPKAAVEAAYRRMTSSTTSAPTGGGGPPLTSTKRSGVAFGRPQIMIGQYAHSRVFPFGMKAYEIGGRDGGEGESAAWNTVWDHLRLLASAAAVHVSSFVLDFSTSGGHPKGLVPFSIERCPVVAVTLDSLCGAVHNVERYDVAMSRFAQLTRDAHGQICHRFGEFAMAIFPSHRRSSAAVDVATKLVQQVPYAVVGVALGKVQCYWQPEVHAIGPALAEAERLCFVAEEYRRPLLISCAAAERCDKAHHRMIEITLDLAPFWTLTSLQMERLEVPEEPLVIPAYDPGSVADDEQQHDDEPSPDAVDFALEQRDPWRQKGSMRPPGPTEGGGGGGGDSRDKKMAGPAAAHLPNEYQLYRIFRTIDVGNVGWIQKGAFLDAVTGRAPAPAAARGSVVTGGLKRKGPTNKTLPSITARDNATSTAAGGGAEETASDERVVLSSGGGRGDLVVPWSFPCGSLVDHARVRQWLEKCNKLGVDRISFAEFSMLYCRLMSM